LVNVDILVVLFEKIEVNVWILEIVVWAWLMGGIDGEDETTIVLLNWWLFVCWIVELWTVLCMFGPELGLNELWILDSELVEKPFIDVTEFDCCVGELTLVNGRLVDALLIWIVAVDTELVEMPFTIVAELTLVNGRLVDGSELGLNELWTVDSELVEKPFINVVELDWAGMLVE